MAKKGRRKRVADSVLLRSAESLGRVIGALQRQLEQSRTAAAPPKRTVRRKARKTKTRRTKSRT